MLSDRLIQGAEDIATCMYYTSIDPFIRQEVYVAKGLPDRKMQRALMQFFKPRNYFMVRDALIQAGRADLLCRFPSTYFDRRTNMTKPVLVVGAGPVGMTMASELVRYGVPVRIVDKAAQRTDKSKALVLWSRTLELLDRGGGSAPFVNAGFKAEAVNFIAGEKVIGHVSMEAVREPLSVRVDAPAVRDRAATRRTAGCDLGVSVERAGGTHHLHERRRWRRSTLRHADGREEIVSVDWLLGCDGAHSAVRHGLGAPFAGETSDSDWMLADVHMTGYPCPGLGGLGLLASRWRLCNFPDLPGPLSGSRGLASLRREHPPTPTLDQVQAVIDRRGPRGMEAFDPIWLAGFRINGRKVSDYRWGRVFLVGDAAHVHSPAGGQGMNTGMQDAFNLAWKLALVVRETCGEHLLDSYSPERSKVGDEVLKAAGRLDDVGTMRNPVSQTIRNLVGHVMLGSVRSSMHLPTT